MAVAQTHLPRVSGALFVFADGYCSSCFFVSVSIFYRKNGHSRHIFHSPQVSLTFPVAFVCVKVLIFALRAFH
jgi:hypothetical protein